MIEYSFIVPVYNDGYLVEPFCVEFEKVFKDYLDLEDIREQLQSVVDVRDVRVMTSPLVRSMNDLKMVMQLLNLKRTMKM